MSLKAFHILFITCSVLLGLFFSGWAIKMYQAEKNIVYIWTAAGALLVSAALIFYGVNFIKKLKDK